MRKIEYLDLRLLCIKVCEAHEKKINKKEKIVIAAVGMWARIQRVWSGCG